MRNIAKKPRQYIIGAVKCIATVIDWKISDQHLHLYYETVADIAYDMGYRRRYISTNSRERIGRIVQWGKAFNEMHKDTDWTRKDYLETMEEFTNSNLRAYFANINHCCPQCGEAATLHCEFIDDQPDYFSLQYYRCGQYWESTDALAALSGVEKWEREIIGKDVRAVLKSLRLDVEPGRQLYGRLEHPASYSGAFIRTGINSSRSTTHGAST